MQRFDLMAIPAKILDERRSGAGMRIADLLLVDGTLQTRTTATQPLRRRPHGSRGNADACFATQRKPEMLQSAQVQVLFKMLESQPVAG